MKNSGIAFLLPFLLLLTGCRCVDKSPRPRIVPECSVEKCRERGLALLKSIQQEDYPDFSRLTAGVITPPVTENQFRRSCADMAQGTGKIRGVRFLTALQTPAARNMVYVVTWERPGRNGKKSVSEVLFQALFGEVDGKIRLLGFRFL